MKFAETLRDELEYQGIQVKELSQKTGISVNTLNKYRPGSTVSPTLENAQKIAEILKVSIDYLATGKIDNDNNSEKSDLQKLIKDLKMFSKSDFETVQSVVKSLREKY
ncbi:MAG: helix-turn-helix transcriptional regulator [Treponema sp.]|nr:helix-turn-helix transcriptional regulator [Treponema sp.]